MKRKLTYRDQLIELAKIYNVKEIQDYIKNKKNLTSGQLELILRKNKIVIPKDFKTNFFRENFSKPLSKVSRRIDDIKEGSSRAGNRFVRKIGYLKEDSSRSVINFFINLWKSIGAAGIAFLNIFPKLGSTVYDFFGNLLINLFNSIYSQQLNRGKTGKVIVAFFAIIGVTTIVISGISTFDNLRNSEEKQIVNTEEKIKKPKAQAKKEIKEPKAKVKKEIKEPKAKVKKEIKKKEKVTELILPDLNLKTKTVLNLFKDVEYDLNKVRYEKRVKPIYFTQFPKDLDAIQSVKLKKETFIKIVLPLIVAENEKILDDRIKLNKIGCFRLF